MLLDFEVHACSRVCVKTGKALDPGEVYFSVLELENGETVRRDYSAAAWREASASSIGWWRSRVPCKEEKPQLAPSEVMLNLLAALADKPADAPFRYVLTLLLIRRRLLRPLDSTRNEADEEVLTLLAPKRDEQFEVVVAEPTPEQAEQIQQRMIDLLYGDSDSSDSSLET